MRGLNQDRTVAVKEGVVSHFSHFCSGRVALSLSHFKHGSGVALSLAGLFSVTI